MSFARVFRAVIKKWYIVAAAVLIALASTVVVESFFVKKEYQSTATCYVPSIYENVNNTDLTSPLLNNFINLAKTNSVLVAVSQDPSLQVLGYSVKELDKILNIGRNNNLIVVTCVADEPIHTQIIANAYINSGFPKVRSLMGADSTTFDYRIVASPAEGVDIGGSMMMSLLLAVIIGGVIGVAIAMLPLINGKMPYSDAEIAENFERRVLATVPNSGRQSMDFKASLAAMITSVQAEKVNKFCITSISRQARADEVTIGLADIISDYASVMIIDCDFRQPTLGQEYNLSGVGLSDYLHGSAALNDIIYDVSSNIKIVPVGNNADVSIQKLLSGSFLAAWGQLSQLAGVVIVITPPCEENADAVTLGTMVGSTVLVMQSATAGRKITKALSTMDIAKINMPGLVLR